MKWPSSLFFGFFVIYNSIANADSRNFWVSPLGNQCNKTQCLCTELYPCTLDNQLINKLVPGDSVKLKSGTYPSFTIDNLNGNLEKPIRFIGPSQGLPAHFSGKIDSTRDVIEIKQSSYITLENLKVSGALRAGIRVNNSHFVTINNNELVENGVWGIFTNHANNFTAAFNKIVGPAKEHGIYQSNSGDNVIITGNYIVNFNGCAVHFNGDLSMGGAPEVAGDGIISNIIVSNNFLAGNG
ncbi:MAG: right-handed parallel beta-helix repeat-containing protein, partial [Paraglaciecola sp.]|nr:right-handed parallel beta-helix repeat-containing protein [Paraglaciecola sp.]